MTEEDEEEGNDDEDGHRHRGGEQQPLLLLGVVGTSTTTTTTTTTIETTSSSSSSNSKASSTTKKKTTTSSSMTSVTKQQRSKLFYAILFGVVCTCRAGLNIASTKYAVSYYITTINSFTPILTSLADSYLLGTKLPKSLWICIFTTCCGCILIAISQKYYENNNELLEDDKQQQEEIQQLQLEQKEEATTTTTMVGGDGDGDGDGGDTISSTTTAASTTTTILFGCLLQFISICFSAIARILMKYTDGILTKIEIVQANNICNVLLPFMYTLMTNVTGWIAFEYLISIKTNLIAFITVSIVVYTIGSTTQVTLVRNIGPGIYTSFNGIRIICSAILSSIVLQESISSTTELLGLCIIIISMTLYTWNLGQQQRQ